MSMVELAQAIERLRDRRLARTPEIRRLAEQVKQLELAPDAQLPASPVRRERAEDRKVCGTNEHPRFDELLGTGHRHRTEREQHGGACERYCKPVAKPVRKRCGDDREEIADEENALGGIGEPDEPRTERDVDPAQ